MTMFEPCPKCRVMVESGLKHLHECRPEGSIPKWKEAEDRMPRKPENRRREPTMPSPEKKT